MSPAGRRRVAESFSRRAPVGYALLTLIWGSSYFFTALALRSFHPLLIIAVRMGIGGVLLGGLVFWLRLELPRRREDWLRLAWLGAFNVTIPYALLTWAQLFVHSSTTIVLAATAPLFVYLLSTLNGSEHFHPQRLAALLMAFGGIGVLALGGGASTTGNWWGPLAIVASSLLYATGNVYTGRHLNRVGPIVSAWLQISFGGLWTLPLVWFTGAWQVTEISWVPVAALLELGVLGSALAYVLFFWFIRHWGSTAASVSTYLQTVVGVVLGVVVLQERPSPGGWAGLMIIIAGLAWFARAGRTASDGRRRLGRTAEFSLVAVPTRDAADSIPRSPDAGE